MSPVFFISVIDFLRSLALDTAHDVVGGFFFKLFQNSLFDLCVGRDIFLTDTSMHSFMPCCCPCLLLLLFFLVVAWQVVK